MINVKIEPGVMIADGNGNIGWILDRVDNLYYIVEWSNGERQERSKGQCFYYCKLFLDLEKKNG